ncbi:hypothetical protein CPB85DRAFT_1435662 [Mucidula mucida]|nr:hypothetical protein CPB85DRAFT_1435662 [Mucidula mucida]
MSLDSLQSFPDLPTDVVRCLFEVAAYEDLCTAEHLTRVSKIVRKWIDPILYHTIDLCTISQLVQFHHSIMLCNEPVFFARSVKFLCLGDFSNGEFYMAALCLQPTFERQKELVQTVLNTCSGVTRLAVWLSVDAHTFHSAFTSASTGAAISPICL